MNAPLAIPSLLPCDGPSVSIQPAEVGGAILYAVTVRDRGGQRRDRWFADRPHGLAHAVEQADTLGLLLLDLTGMGDD